MRDKDKAWFNVSDCLQVMKLGRELHDEEFVQDMFKHISKRASHYDVKRVWEAIVELQNELAPNEVREYCTIRSYVAVSPAEIQTIR